MIKLRIQCIDAQNSRKFQQSQTAMLLIDSKWAFPQSSNLEYLSKFFVVITQLAMDLYELLLQFNIKNQVKFWKS